MASLRPQFQSIKRIHPGLFRFSQQPPFRALQLCQSQSPVRRQIHGHRTSIGITGHRHSSSRTARSLSTGAGKMAPEKSEYVSHIFKDGIFADKVVFCTGGAGSICSAQVRALVTLGANAFIIGRNPEKTESMASSIASSRSGSRVKGMGNIDVRSVESLQSAVDACIREFGRIDFAIAGAAGNFLAPMAQLSANAFKTVIDIDLLGSYNTAKVCLPHLVAAASKHPSAKDPSPSGRMLFVSATLHYSGTPLQTHAAAAKAGVDALSTQICIEYGPMGVTSNVIAPGPIAGTEGMDRLAKKREATADGKNPFRVIPSGRMGSVKDIADATVYLFSDAANYVNGEILVVDGGAWRMSSGPGADFAYPDFLLEGGTVDGVAGMKKEKGKGKSGESKL